MTSGSSVARHLPAPATVVEFIRGLFVGEWPEAINDVAQFFRDHSIVPVGQSVDAQDDGLRILDIQVPVDGVGSTSWTADADAFLGITLFLFESQTPDDVDTRAAYLDLQREFDAEFGPGVNAWEDEKDPPRRWDLGRFEVTTHYFHMKESQVMLSIEDREVAAAAEAKARQRRRR
jgi:hypothetical protein